MGTLSPGDPYYYDPYYGRPYGAPVIVPVPVPLRRGPVWHGGPRGRGHMHLRGETEASNVADNEQYLEQGDHLDEEALYYEQEQTINSAANVEPIAGEAADGAMTLEKYQNDIANHPHAKGNVKMEKIHCDACNGHTILADGQHMSNSHTSTCSVFLSGAHLKLGNQQASLIGCHEKKKKKCVKPPLVVPVEVEEESSDDESSSSSCDDEVLEKCAPPPEKACKKKKKKQVLDVVIETNAQLAEKIAAAHSQNKPLNCCFDRVVNSADGKGSYTMRVAVKSSARNAENVSALQVELTHLKDGALVGNTIGAPMWHVDHNAAQLEKKFLFQKSNLASFHSAGVHKEAVQEAVTFIEKAIGMSQKK